MKKSTKKIVKGRNRHGFKYTLTFPGLSKPSEEKTVWAETRYIQKPVHFLLKPAHVKDSIRANGSGNMALCAGAMCAHDSETKAAFRGAIPDHFIDSPDFAFMVEFWHSRIFISVHNSKDSGMPDICYAGAVDGTLVTHINDSGLKGQRQLLTELEKDGPLVIHVKPIHPSAPREKGRRKGGRPGDERGPNGGKRRVARLGAITTGVAATAATAV